MFNDKAYDRGRRDARLDNHQNQIRFMQLSQIGAYIVAGVGLSYLGSATQKLGDKAEASAATTIALAVALKEEKDTARDTLADENTKGNSRWTKFQTVAASSSSVIAFLGYIYLTHPH